MKERLRTVDALAYAGIERPFFNSVVQRQLYTDLPVVNPGRIGRFFGAHDLVALEVFGELLRIGVMLHIAARLASDLRAWLRADARVQTLHLVTVADANGGTRAEIVKRAPDDATVLWIIHVAKARRLARQTIAEQ